MKILLLTVVSFMSLICSAQQYSYVGGTSNNSWPFNGTAAGSNKVQWIYRSTDFPTAPSGIITDVYFKLSGSSIGGTPTYTNLDIKMGATSLIDFPAGVTPFITGLQQVFFSASIYQWFYYTTNYQQWQQKNLCTMEFSDRNREYRPC